MHRSLAVRSLSALATLVLAVALAGISPAAHANGIFLPWPDARIDKAPAGSPVTFASHSPYALADVGKGVARDPGATAQGTLFMPPGASAKASAPAVILLHGAAGVLGARELTYARQFAARGVAALVVDVFAARRDRYASFIERVMEITEAMYLADAYAGLHFLAGRPEIDAARVALIGFSYGGMVATYAAYEQVASMYAPSGRRFAAHAAFYAPCIAEFRDSRATGAPLLMLYGGRDGIIDAERCAEIADQLRQGGGRVEIAAFPEAVHQWDGGSVMERNIGRDISECDFVVARDGTVAHRYLPLTMNNSLSRKIMLGLCADGEGYLIGRNDAVRAKANAALAGFLSEAFTPKGR